MCWILDRVSVNQHLHLNSVTEGYTVLSKHSVLVDIKLLSTKTFQVHISPSGSNNIFLVEEGETI